MEQLDDLVHRGGRHAAACSRASRRCGTRRCRSSALADAGQPGDSDEVEAAVRWLLDKEVRTRRRLGEDRPRRRAGRLVLRVPQRLLPRHRRHGDGADGAGPHGPRDARRGAAGGSPRDQLAARDAEPRRRLGGVRPRHQPRDARRRCRSPTTTRCSTRAARTSPPACSKRSATTAIASGRRRSIARSRSSSRRQEDARRWFGRWGVNYIYGTWQVLVGLAAIGFDMHAPMVRRAVRWLKDVQNAGGGWGESCRQLRRSGAGRAGRSDRVADRVGAARPDRRRRSATRPKCGPASSTWSARRTPTAAGTRSRSPAPASRRCSI